MSLTKTILAQPISNPYLLVTFLPYHVDGDGEVWIDRLWRKDLVEHLVYVKNLTLLAPKHLDLDFRDAVKITRDQAKRIKFVALPKAISLSGALRALPKTILQSWKAVGEASIVHSSVIGWPIPIGWIVAADRHIN